MDTKTLEKEIRQLSKEVNTVGKYIKRLLDCVEKEEKAIEQYAEDDCR